MASGDLLVKAREVAFITAACGLLYTGIRVGREYSETQAAIRLEITQLHTEITLLRLELCRAAPATDRPFVYSCNGSLGGNP